MLLEQFGGANGELAAAMQYSIQGLNCDDPGRKDLLMDIGTEELSHLEIGKAGGGGGGGERNPLPATKGAAPKFSFTQIAPPMVHTQPDSQFQATLLGPPDLKIPSPNMDNYGDPLSKLITNSGGPGGGSGIGSVRAQALAAAMGGARTRSWHRRRHWRRRLSPRHERRRLPNVRVLPGPRCSEEARKAKYQGTVVLQAVITADGRATEIQVVKGPGLGLEEKAMEAVQQWRFKPAIGPGGKPRPVVVPIEVTFRLL